MRGPAPFEPRAYDTGQTPAHDLRKAAPWEFSGALADPSLLRLRRAAGSRQVILLWGEGKRLGHIGTRWTRNVGHSGGGESRLLGERLSASHSPHRLEGQVTRPVGGMHRTAVSQTDCVYEVGTDK